MNLKRVRKLNGQDTAAAASDSVVSSGPVVYWMSREQRVYDNWALVYAQLQALKSNKPLIVVFCLADNYPGANLRHYDFMIEGLIETEKKLSFLNIPFFILIGNPEIELNKFIFQKKVGLLVSDFDPLSIKRKWKDRLISKIDIPFYEVDAHNIIPCFLLSHKQEFAAYTIRPKIKRLLPEFLEEFPPLEKMKELSEFPAAPCNWDGIKKSLKLDATVLPVKSFKPGEDAALQVLSSFLEKGLSLFKDKRNDPNCSSAQSNLSPYLHLGHISAQRVALNADRYSQFDLPSVEAFLEELIVRKELSDNFCFYNPSYDSFDGFPQWAKNSLNAHRLDKREFIYNISELENAATHDRLWNASQTEMVRSGKMHGYMRMYWAKKILEWTASPEEALAAAIYLNNKYELDGRDPNGYTGIAWSIGGLHDRAWGERKIFGKIRYMSYNGCRRKFDIESYIRNNS
ncbi:MAG: deoxyribodipyrimidine photo-lyase [Bacteroidota bacterium]|nr:deoxyribodipyrimidine photo-lyase [Bacteroidota bacterium]